jgi:hypothetical protein
MISFLFADKNIHMYSANVPYRMVGTTLLTLIHEFFSRKSIILLQNCDYT